MSMGQPGYMAQPIMPPPMMPPPAPPQTIVVVGNKKQATITNMAQIGDLSQCPYCDR